MKEGSAPQAGSSGPAPLAPDRWSPPPEFEEYRIHRPLGRGRTGRVYLAQDTLLDRPVAVKFIRALHPNDLARFMLEARAAARIQHPNVLTLYRVGQLDDRPFLVSEYVRGTTLDRLARPVPWQKVVELGIQLGRGLAAAHRAGVLHRDLKPGNVMVADGGEVKLLDFGLAKLVGVRDVNEDSGDPNLSLPVSGSGESLDPLDLPSLPPGTLVGTPYFMAPEAWRGEPATVSTDLYSLGVILYELAAGRGPFRHVPLKELPRAIQEQLPRPLGEAAPEVEPRFAAVVDRCLRPDVADRFASAEELVDALQALVEHVSPAAIPEGNPYRGLHAFQEEHRALFFGRGRDIRAVLDRLSGRGLVVVTGDSGVGKSSLILAGVLPRVAEGALGDRRRWRIARMVPGGRPVLAAAAALAPLLKLEEPEVERLLLEDPQGVLRALRQANGAEKGALLYVDQLEELVTLAPPHEAKAVAALLAQLGASVPGCRVIGSARSDFLTRLAGLPGLDDAISAALYLLRPLGAEEIREVITGPARVKHARFESEALVETLVESTLATESGLPLLQFALAELWERREVESGVIRAAALEAMGGVAGALARHADQAMDALAPEQRAEARRILLRLITLEGTRARRTEEELIGRRQAAAVALQALISARLVVARQGESGVTYDIAHEALLHGWSTLGVWLQEAAEARQLHARVEQAASEWERLGRAREATWSPKQLAEVASLDVETLTARERAFLEASRRASSRRKLLARTLAVAFVVALSATYGGVRFRARWVLDRQIAAQLAQADSALEIARTHRRAVEQARQRAFAAFDAADVRTGNDAWLDVVDRQPRADAAYAQASDALERAVVLDAERTDVRDRFAKVLAERAASAEARLRFAERDALVQRLKLYDETGALSRPWTQPLRLSLQTSPAGAEVILARYRTGPEGLELAEERPLGVTPLADVALERGSYLLTVTAPGHAPVRHPLLADGWTEKRLELVLPAEGEVPPGFVHVAAGTFLYGTGADESIRQFFNAVPLHPVETPPFLISTHEVTFGEYLDYLRALPADERARRAPRPMATAGVASQVPQLELAPAQGGRWRLTLKPSTVVMAALEGEPVHYPQRTVNATQDWRRMPVGGIDFDDARAYAAWLAATGKVPGARLCTEVEWERAARGADGREYPHGDRLLPADANYDATYGKVAERFGPDEVGLHPRSRSPFGVDDLTGNVWEWVESSLERDGAVARGGSYAFAASTCRATNREQPARGFRDLSVGFRVCADARR